ncbi:hypothetical protein BH09BAC2_BH09BAC2_17450 [soil metagenome]
MAASLQINDILTRVKKLDKEDQLNLIQKIALLLKKKETPENSVCLTALTGLGSEVWKDVDIDNYIDGERQW